MKVKYELDLDEDQFDYHLIFNATGLYHCLDEISGAIRAFYKGGISSERTIEIIERLLRESPLDEI